MVHILTPPQLIIALANIPKSYQLHPNNLGNLCVLDENGQYVGFIDFDTGECNIP